MSVLPWRRVTALDVPETTVVYEKDPTSPLVSLDYLRAEVTRCNNKVVDCECELAKAQQALAKAGEDFVKAVHRTAQDFARSGITLRLDDE